MKNFSEESSAGKASQTSTPAETDPHTVKVDEILKDLIPDFMTRRFQELSQIQDWIQAQDFTALAQYGHKLKGSSLNYGFNHLGNLARELETAARDHNMPQISSLAAQIQDHIQKVQIVYVEEL